MFVVPDAVATRYLPSLKYSLLPRPNSRLLLLVNTPAPKPDGGNLIFLFQREYPGHGPLEPGADRGTVDRDWRQHPLSFFLGRPLPARLCADAVARVAARREIARITAGAAISRLMIVQGRCPFFSDRKL